MLRAKQLGVKSEAQRNRKGNFSFLDKLTTNSFYWWGFIMADGHISDRGLHIGISTSDLDHLSKIKSHLNIENMYVNTSKQLCSIALEDKAWSIKWRDLLKINGQKTYNPPNLSLFENKDSFIYFLIGFIDGDGSIWLSRNQPNMRIELHLSWLPVLEKWSKLLLEYYGIQTRTRTTSRGYSQLIFNKKDHLKILLPYLQEVDYLERKWDKLLNIFI